MMWIGCGILWLGTLLGAGPVTPPEFDAAFAAVEAAKGKTNEAGRLRALFDVQWRYSMADSPELATYVGFPEFNDRWSDLSPAAIARRRVELARTRRVLEGVDASQLDPDSRLYRDLFDAYLRLDEEGARFPTEYLIFNQLQGPQAGVAHMLSLMSTSTTRGVEDVLARMKSAPAMLRQRTELLREGLRKGITAPRVPLRTVPANLKALLPDDPRQSAFFRPFESLPPAASEADKARWRGEALAAITNGLYPAFREFERFVVDEYLPGATTNIACVALPDGRDWYLHRVRRSTTLTLSPDEIHEIGLSEVRRIRAEMEKVKAEAGFNGELSAFFHHLRTDPKFYHETGTALLAGYRDISKRVDGGLPKLFGKLPRLPYGVMPIPSYAERSQTTAYYQPGSLTAGRPGNFFANTYNLQMRPKWEMEALTVHEAVPGHHLQIALAQELEGVPEFQRQAETTAFVEGWALYAESLGPDLGLYTDPYSRFGQLTYEMWRAIRLVVDTGMHWKGWSREQAIRYFMENAGKTEHDITVEVDRYIVWPGQALAYKLGQLKILELRRHAEKELGADFDLRAFHDELLSKGALPLTMLETRMKAWVASRRK